MTMINSIVGALVLGNVVTIAADRFTGAGIPNTAGILGAIIGGIACGGLTIQKLTKSGHDGDRDLS